MSRAFTLIERRVLTEVAYFNGDDAAREAAQRFQDGHVAARRHELTGQTIVYVTQAGLLAHSDDDDARGAE